MTSKRCLFLLFLLGCTSPLYSQDEAEVAAFQRLLTDEGNAPTEKLLAESELTIQQARETRDAREEARATRNLGLIFLNRVHDYERALDLFIRSLSISDSLRFDDQRVLTYVCIARVFEVVGDYYKSAQFLEQALTINRAGRNINADALILIGLGKVNASRGRLQEALQNYQQVLRYVHDIERTHEANALFNLGHLFTLQGNYTDALDYHRKALRVFRDLRDKQAEANCLNDIGVLYGLMNDSGRSRANHTVALEIRKRIEDKRGITESCNNLGIFHLEKGETEEAIRYGQLALEYGREAQAREEMLRSYDLLSQAFKALGDFKSALEYKELGVAIQDFIQSEKNERQLLERQNRYVVEAKETQIQRLDALRVEREQELAAQRRFRNVLYLVVALIMMTAGLLFVLYLVKRRSNITLQAAQREVERQNEKLQELNQTKDKFFSIISHDLKGPLNSLTSFSGLLMNHIDRMSKEEIQMLAKDLDQSVKNLLSLLENLLAWSRSQTGNIDFSPETFNLAELLEENRRLLQGQATAKRISIEVASAPDMTVRLHQASLNTVVRNLISNALKFTPEGGAVRVSTRVDANALHILVADNGVGMPPEVVGKLFRVGSKHSTRGTATDKGTGLGLLLCREFVEKNGGKISVKSTPGKGSVFICSFPSSVMCAVPGPEKSVGVSS